MEEIEDALRLLQTLHRQRNRVPVQDTVQALLRATRAHAGLALRPGGEQALANVLHVVELARQYEASEGASFRGFVQQFLDETFTEAAESPNPRGGDGRRAPDDRPQGQGPRVPRRRSWPTSPAGSRRTGPRARSFRRAACACRRSPAAHPPNSSDLREAEMARDRAEGHRLAYVAATRARDLLVIPGVGDEPYPNDEAGREMDRRAEPRHLSRPPLAHARERRGVSGLRARHRARTARRGVGGVRHADPPGPATGWAIRQRRST